jgi:imidazolonepropionase-like amidohydrolase
MSTRELLILQEAGLAAIDCLRAATVNGAHLLGLSDSIGCLKPGASADLIAIRGDPLRDLSLLETHLFFVMRDGSVIKHLKHAVIPSQTHS